jgi:hypothetical protein
MLKHMSLVSESAAANIGLCLLVSRKHGHGCNTKSLRKVPRVLSRSVCKNMFWRLLHQGTTVKNFRWGLLKQNWGLKQNVSKRNWNFCVFCKFILCIYELRTLAAFSKTCRNISVLFPAKCRLIHYLILFGSHNVKGFCKPCANI